MSEINRRKLVAPVILSALFVVAFLVSWRARQQGLIYPDGYQYLLMAKGIAAHLAPTTQLNGYRFTPSIDAALKPLFPALTALFSVAASLITAARIVTALSAAAVIALTCAVATKLTSSRIAGVVAGVALLVSPILTYWSGFAGPDPLAEALALACGLAILYRRAHFAGVLGALCLTSRPEWGLALMTLALASLFFTNSRAFAGRSLVVAALTLSLVIAILRPPLGLPLGGGLALLAALLAGVGLQVGVRFMGTPQRARVAAMGVCAITLLLVITREFSALDSLFSSEYPLFIFGAWGLVNACWRGHARLVLPIAAVAAFLLATYQYRNPDSVRYTVQLLPLVVLLGAFSLSSLQYSGFKTRVRSYLPLAVGVFLALFSIVSAPAPASPSSGPDMFQTLAASLRSAPPGTLVSAAPDAYGYLLPHRAQALLKIGERGLILLDGAQRAYAPQLTARGQTVAVYDVPNGFERADGTLDSAPAILVRGVVVRARLKG